MLFIHSFACEEGWFLLLYLYGGIIVFSIGLLLELGLAWFSSRGSILNSEKRGFVAPVASSSFPPSPVGPLLASLAFLFSAEVGWALLGSYWAFSTNHCLVLLPELAFALKVLLPHSVTRSFL